MATEHSTVDDFTTEGEDMARQTAQAKLLRDARDELGITSEELAGRLGVSLPTLRNWLAPADNKVHRTMPETAKILLGYILRDAKQAKKKHA
jgi:transcriptional regulator with XRE-family HTH domain